MIKPDEDDAAFKEGSCLENLAAVVTGQILPA